MIKRVFYLVAPNGDKCSVIWANKEKTLVQTWSAKNKRWESFPLIYCKILKAY